MKKFFTSFSIISVITIFLFVLINFFISISWKYYNSKKYELNDPFPKNIQKVFEISNVDQRILHRDTHYLSYYFKAFVGPLPKNFKSKYVNYDTISGRKTLNPQECEKIFYFFGGSTAFGWLSIDDKTIASYLSEILNKNSKKNCVYNYGSPWFYSKQENNLFISLLETQRIPNYAIFLNGINERCGGFIYEKNIRNQFAEINTKHRTGIFYAKMPSVIKSLPIVQLYERLINKNIVQFQLLDENIKCSDETFKNNFISRLKLRQKICDIYSIKCISFLQPFGGINGKIYPGSQNLKSQFRKYDLFKSIDQSLIVDVTNALDNDNKKFSYVDATHYSHNANYLIALQIAKNIF